MKIERFATRISLAALLALLALLITVGPLAAGEPKATDIVHLKIRPQVAVAGETVTLGDVLIFPATAEQLRADLAHQPLVAPSAATPNTVTHEQIEQRLRELGVDVNRILVEGASACQIVYPKAETPIGSAPVRRSGAGKASSVAQTLVQLIQEHVNHELASLGGTAELEFEQASNQYLELTTPPFDLTLQPQGRGKLGLREFRVVVRRDGKTQRTVSVFARVRLSKAVLVARKPLSVGSSIERGAAEPEPRLFEREEDFGFDQVEQVIGQQVAKFVPAGQMLHRADVKAVDLVQRSRPVTVIGSGPNVHIRLTGVALDAGSYGDTVRVRLGEGRQSRNVLRGVVTGMGTVRVAEEG